jgi:hypothetical protein
VEFNWLFVQNCYRESLNLVIPSEGAAFAPDRGPWLGRCGSNVGEAALGCTASVNSAIPHLTCHPERGAAFAPNRGTRPLRLLFKVFDLTSSIVHRTSPSSRIVILSGSSIAAKNLLLKICHPERGAGSPGL